MPTNTTVTITYANGEQREFVASDELEKLIGEGEMFSVTTMHSDISHDEEMSMSKMYAGNPIAAMGHMMMMKRNAEMLPEDDEGIIHKPVIIEILSTCIALLSEEVTSHQSGMSPIEKSNRQHEGRMYRSDRIKPIVKHILDDLSVERVEDRRDSKSINNNKKRRAND